MTIYQSLLLENTDVEVHFELAEPLGNGSHDPSEKGGIEEPMMVY